MAIGSSTGRGTGEAPRGIGQRTGPFRPFRAFTEGERNLFFGREAELHALGELFSSELQTAVVMGDSGVGKTSFLRAGVLPHFTGRGVSCLYMSGARLIDDIPAPGPAGALLLLDDLGAALYNPKRIDMLVSILRRVAQSKTTRVLFAIDDTSLHRLDPFEKVVGPIAAPGARLRLERFDEGRASDVLERTVLGGGAYFEAGLSREMAQDLCIDGPVSPCALQVVAGTAVALQLTTSRAFRRAGGAEALEWRYFEIAIAEAGGAPAARLVGDLAGQQGTRALERLAFGAGVDTPAAQRIAARLEAAGLVVSVDEGYRLSNEWVRSPLTVATGPLRGQQIEARLALRRAVAGGGLLGPASLARVRRHAGGLRPDEAVLVARSSRVTAAAMFLVFAVALALTAASYVRAGRSHYFDTAGFGPGAPVVVRLGKPGGLASRLPHGPAFHTVRTDTGFAAAALRGPLPEGALSGEWTEEIASALRPLPRSILALLTTGDAHRLAEVFEDPSGRVAALDALAAAGSGATAELELVRRGLEDEAEAVRRHAVQAAVAMEWRKPGSGAALLPRAWKDPSGAVRVLAASEVGRLPDAQAVPLFVAALAEDPLTRKAALDAIGARVERTPAAAAALAGALAGPAGHEAGALVQRVIGGAGAGADALVAALGRVALDVHAPEDARLEALRLLRLSPKPPDGLESIAGTQRLAAAVLPIFARKRPEEAAQKIADAMKGPPILRAGAAAAIGVLPRTADTPKLLKVLSYDNNVEVRAEASRAQVALGREALPLLMKDSKQGGAEVERAAVETIGAFAGKLGFSSAIAALELAAKGPRPATRKAAIEALGRLAADKPGPIAASLGRLSREKSPQVRADAASGLGDVLERGAKEAVAALRAQGKDPDPQTRAKAAEALGRARGPLAPLAAHALASLIDDADPSVRAAVAGALGALGAGANAEGAAVVQLLGDRDGGTRAAARRAAQVLGSATAPAGKAAIALDRVLLAGLPQASVPDRVEIAITAGKTGALGAVRVAAVRGLVGQKAVAQLARAARSTELEVRIAALEAIGEVGGVEARRVLEEALGEAEERVRIAAARGLGRLGADAAPALERMLHDPVRGVRDAAGMGLGRAWQGKKPEELFERLAIEDDADLRYAAALAIAGRGGADAQAVAQRLDAVAASGSSAVKLAARLARAYLGHAEEMAEFLRVLRDGA